VKYPAIKSKRFTGSEPIIYNGNKVTYLLSFWQWAYSDLIGNTERGTLAEYIVACALGINNEDRISWGRYDLVTPKGVTIEVKTSGYLQTWEQQELSRIQFGISETLGWDNITNKYDDKRRRQAQIYVFCVHNHKEQDTINPLDVNQWDFYILPADTLNGVTELKSQKTISLSTLEKLKAQKCEYNNLLTEIEKYTEQLVCCAV